MKHRCLPIFLMVIVSLVLVWPAAAQSIISAKSGAIHHIEGRVLVDNQPLQLRFGQFPNLKDGSVLRTERGRAEILLTPGVIVRVGENSALRMISNRLADTRLEFLNGRALIEVMEILKDNSVTFFSNGASISLLKSGLYRLDSNPPELRVYKGKALVRKGDQILKVKKGRLVDLGDYLAATKFDSKRGDSLYRWSARRSSYLAMANLSAARSLRRWGIPWGMAGWRYNPYFGMFTFIPASGMFYSPFGFSYFSPQMVYVVYAPPRTAFGGGGGWSADRYYNPNYGYVVTSRRSAARVPVSVARPSSSGAAATVAPSPRAGAVASPRGGASGGHGR